MVAGAGVRWHLEWMETHVLVVDDEPDFVELITYGLEANGFRCSSAGNGMLGLDMARRLHPSAMVLDVMLPDLDGFTICEMIRKQPGLSGMPILMLTCLGGTLPRLNGLSSGADDYLVKPLKIPLLIDRIRLAVRLRSEAVNESNSA